MPNERRALMPATALGLMSALFVAAAYGCVNKNIDVGGGDGAACEEDALRCTGAVLQRCVDGDFDTLSECASAALCERSVSAEDGECAEMVCEPEQGSCGGGQTDTTALRCRTDGSGEDQSFCENDTAQCNPATGACIALDVDPTEVTRDAYEAFLADPSALDDQPAGCAFNDDFAPDAECMASEDVCQGEDCGEHPQVCVDYCDALAYCAAQGQRLCGRIAPTSSSGPGVPFDRGDDPGVSQWMNACSSGGQSDFAFDAPINDMPCNGAAAGLGTTHAVGTRPECHAVSLGYAALFDLSGNVAEWEDACDRPADDDAAGADDLCRVRGGSYDSEIDALRCDALPALPLARGAVDPRVGFRCCD